MIKESSSRSIAEERWGSRAVLQAVASPWPKKIQWLGPTLVQRKREGRGNKRRNPSREVSKPQWWRKYNGYIGSIWKYRKFSSLDIFNAHNHHELWLNCRDCYLLYSCPSRTIPFVRLRKNRLTVHSPQVFWSLKVVARNVHQ